MKDRKTLFLPEIGQPQKMSYGDDARKSVISLMDELSVPQNERPIMLGEVDELPERLRTKRERLKSLGVRISDSCDGDNTLLIEVPNDIKLDFPIFLLEVSLCAIQPNRNIKIKVGEGATASFVLGSPVPALYALSPVMSSLDVEAETGSTVRLAMLHSYLNEIDSSSSFKIKIGSGAAVETSILTLKAGRILRVEGDVEVAENGAFRLSETSMLEDNNLKASWVHVKLTGPNARAELNSSDFNFDSSETRTAFFVEVMAGAQNAAGSIFSSGVNFSENATQLFLPGLITHEEDVDLHHGASSGKWTAEQVEYLRTRGLSLHDIAILLVDSILSASMYPLLTDKLVEYTKRYVARIFRGRRISF